MSESGIRQLTNNEEYYEVAEKYFDSKHTTIFCLRKRVEKYMPTKLRSIHSNLVI